MNGYKSFYNGNSVDIYAETKFEAHKKAVEYFQNQNRRRKVKSWDVSTNLCEKDGNQVIHIADF